MSQPFRDTWTNLAGPASRWSPRVGPGGPARRHYEGLVKLRLVHIEGRSYLIPDVLIAVGGMRYFLPSFFSPPLIAFHVEDGRHVARFSVDFGAPRAPRLERLFLQVRSEDRLHTYDDGAQLYRCTFDGPRGLASLAKGQCRPGPKGDVLLRVFHHTTPANAAGIRTGGELWSSAWNLAGTHRLLNVAYGYFTTLPSVRDEEDLRLIAMASGGTIQFQTTSDRPREEILSLKVYRGDTKDRTAALAVDVPCGLIAPAHLFLHPNVGGSPAWFEVVSPEIVRVGVVPSAKLRLSGPGVSVPGADLKRFDHVIVGDAGTLEGLSAPYKEEDTLQIAHLERLDTGMDLFDFWLANRNTDQVSGRVIDPRRLEPA